jgi:superfamily II DNA or RNA helicase
VQNLELKNSDEWREWCKSGEKPVDIPANPNKVYKDIGWISMGDWLGYAKGWNGSYRSFEEAREFVWSLGLKTEFKWREWRKSGERPVDIPSNPNAVYKDIGWISMGDWLGTGFVACQNREYRSFEEAREFVQNLELKNSDEWNEWCKSGERPVDIPSTPSAVYKDIGWISLGDWLGVIGAKNRAWTKKDFLHFIQSLKHELHLLPMPQLLTILNSNNLDRKLKEIESFKALISTQAGSQKRLDQLEAVEINLKEQIKSGKEDEEEISQEVSDLAEVLKEDDNLDISDDTTEKGLEPFDPIEGLKVVDNRKITASLDDENIEFLMKDQLKELWNIVLNDENEIDRLKSADYGERASIIRHELLEELKQANDIEIPSDYRFKHQPNLMQRLLTVRLKNEKSYGNWSGTGAGKTLSAVLAGRVLGAKNTVIICNNSTVEGWVESIDQYFDNNNILVKNELELDKDYSDRVLKQKYQIIDKYDIDLPEGNNYLVLNYETFQQKNSEFIVSELLKKNRIDYIVLDEVQNVKQRQEDESLQSTRRDVVNKLMIQAQKDNSDLYKLLMSATPIINNLVEPKKLIEILTGEVHDELKTREDIMNGLELYKALTRFGLRYKPKYDIAVKEQFVTIDGSELTEQVRGIYKGDVLAFEQALLPLKLKAIQNEIKKGVVIYTHYVSEMKDQIGDYVTNLGFKVGYYTGDDKRGLDAFKKGRIDVLVSSSPISTGVDGLQYVCNTLIPICLPWTSSEYQQLLGRFNRQGSNFDKVNVFIPQVTIETDKGVWSWDKRRWNIIRHKATMADLVIDGIIPHSLLPSKDKLVSKAHQELLDWIDRLEKGEIHTIEREEMNIPLNVERIETKRSQLGDFSELNKHWSVSGSNNTHNRLKSDPEEWYYYHTLYSEARKTWKEIPFIELAKKLKTRPDWIVGDFGCGENLLAKEIENKVHAFDHVSVEDSVVACDIKKTPLEDKVLDVAVFSLSLMGSNYKEYFKEANRVLKPYGQIMVCEPAKKWEGREDQLKSEIEESGFNCFNPVKNTGKFVYIDGVKK